ncbi:MAG: hypothetical protein BroJett026_35780 [Betaproteobacteria bacterium]|nr:MAG: hypothetical protein BroJett026_35780 [Betaproteobacteria bacterium]
MARIVAGLFEDQPAADGAIARLHAAHVASPSITSFVLNPPGMHHGLPLGGDVDADPQARGGEAGAVRGAALGGAAGIAAGLVAAPLVGPAGLAAGIGAGAFVGALAGAANAMGGNPGTTPSARPGGIIVAVNADDTPEALAVDTLHAAGARMVEVADGDWAGGRWRDFDALHAPRDVVATRGNPDYPT